MAVECGVLSGLCGVLSGLWTLGLRGYHLIHLMLMACLFGLAVALYRQRSRRGAADRAVSLWFAPAWLARPFLIPVILAGNMITWITRVQARVADYPILYYGSFVFNATIYVILPWLAIRYLIARRFSLAAVAVMIGAVFIAYSDLVLFDSWFRLPVGTPVPTVLYASNWILYFGGQCLLNVFPSSLAQALDADTVGRENYSAPQP